MSRTADHGGTHHGDGTEIGGGDCDDTDPIVCPGRSGVRLRHPWSGAGSRSSWVGALAVGWRGPVIRPSRSRPSPPSGAAGAPVGDSDGLADTDAPDLEPTPEACNGVDDDCDGQLDALDACAPTPTCLDALGSGGTTATART